MAEVYDHHFIVIISNHITVIVFITQKNISSSLSPEIPPVSITAPQHHIITAPYSTILSPLTIISFHHHSHHTNRSNNNHSPFLDRQCYQKKQKTFLCLPSSFPNRSTISIIFYHSPITDAAIITSNGDLIEQKESYFFYFF